MTHRRLTEFERDDAIEGVLAGHFGGAMLTAVIGSLFLELLRASGRKQTETVGGNTMSQYEVIGDEWDDDEFEGAIGADDDDELLEELISGIGDTDIIGAAKKKSATMRIKKALYRKLLAKNAGAVVRRGLSTRRRNPLGFVPTSIGAGATVQVPSSPQNLFRPERLVVPSDIAFDFGVSDIKVGNVSQLVQSAEVPAAIFSEVSIDTDVNFDTAEIGNQVSVNVRNKSAGAIEFTAALLGTIAKR